MINSFWITIVIIIVIITNNIINVYTIKTYIIAKECNGIKIIAKDSLAIKKYGIINFLNQFTHNKPIRNKF